MVQDRAGVQPEPGRVAARKGGLRALLDVPRDDSDGLRLGKSCEQSAASELIGPDVRMDLPQGVRVVRPLVAVPRPEPAFFVGAFRGVDLEVARRAGARFVEVLLAEPCSPKPCSPKPCSPKPCSPKPSSPKPCSPKPSSPKPSSPTSTSAVWRDSQQPRRCLGGRRSVARRVRVLRGHLLGPGRRPWRPSVRAFCATQRPAGPAQSSSCPSEFRSSVIGTTGRK